jgi:autotransporter adhesin
MVINTTCANTVNNTETGLATTNAQLAALTTQSSAGDAATLAAANGYTNYKAAETLKAANQYTDTKAAETLSTAKTYTDTKSSETLQAANTYTNEQVQKLDTKTAGGIAATTAMINIPAPVSAGSTMSFGVGIGSYDGQTAIAVGGQKRISDNGLVRFGIASGTGKGAKPAVGLGAAWEF